MTKKIFNEMMRADSYIYETNVFYVKRWTKDALNNEVDKLEIRFKPVNNIELSLSRELISRDFESVKAEIAVYIVELYTEAGNELAKRFKNGAM